MSKSIERHKHDIHCLLNINGDATNYAYHTAIITPKHNGPDIHLILSKRGWPNKLICFELEEAKALVRKLLMEIKEAEFYAPKNGDGNDHHSM